MGNYAGKMRRQVRLLAASNNRALSHQGHLREQWMIFHLGNHISQASAHTRLSHSVTLQLLPAFMLTSPSVLTRNEIGGNRCEVSDFCFDVKTSRKQRAW